MTQRETDRIRRVYADRDRELERDLYAWYRPEVLLQRASYSEIVAPLIRRVFGDGAKSLKALNVGCGTGEFLRLLVDWGCFPGHLVGTELLGDRLQKAKLKSASGIRWHLGDLRSLSATGFDLVAAHTVFSSILETGLRHSLAQDMLDKTRRGGWALVFDFRYNNPNNSNVRRVTRRELEQYFAPARSIYRTLHLAPPLARRIAPVSPFLCRATSVLMPFLRTHFVLLMQKP